MVSQIDKKNKKFKKPHIGNGFMCDRVEYTGKGSKPDCYGVFTHFNAWGFPCNRVWNTLITLFEVPKDGLNIVLSVRKLHTKESKIVSTVNIEKAQSPMILDVFMSHKFMAHGEYLIECSILNYSAKLKIPFEIRLADWIEFTKEEIEFTKIKPNIIKKARANVLCEDCHHSYLFEEVIDNSEPLDGGVMRFPESGVFECITCGHMMNLKDLQGQLRSILKSNIKSAMGGE